MMSFNFIYNILLQMADGILWYLYERIKASDGDWRLFMIGYILLSRFSISYSVATTSSKVDLLIVQSLH